MADARKNLAYSLVATAPSPAVSGTSLVVTAGHGTRFPTAPFNATVWPINTMPTPTNAEIVRVTVVSTDTLTITRAQESTSARTIVVGDQIAATITTLMLDELVVGPASSVDNAIARYDSTTGKLLQGYTSGAPTISDTGTMTIGTQHTGGAALRVSHAEPAAGNPNAYYGIWPLTTTFTNDGTYYDHSGHYGWNGDLGSATEPSFGMFLENKFSNGDGNFLLEIHLAAQFQDGPTVEQRVLSFGINRAAPHAVSGQIKGALSFYASSISPSVLNTAIADNGDWIIYNGSDFTIRNYAGGASSTGHEEFQIVSDDTTPDVRWSLSSAIKARLAVTLATSVVTMDVSYTAGGKFEVAGISAASAYLTAPYVLATAAGPYDATNSPLRIIDAVRGLYSTASGVTGLAAGGAAMEWDHNTANPATIVRMFGNTSLGWTADAAGSGNNATITGTFDTKLTRAAAGVLSLLGNATGAALQFTEMTAPTAPAANSVIFFSEDDGTGKTRVMARFNSGPDQQVVLQGT